MGCLSLSLLAAVVAGGRMHQFVHVPPGLNQASCKLCAGQAIHGCQCRASRPTHLQLCTTFLPNSSHHNKVCTHLPCPAEARMTRAEAASLVGMAGWRLHDKVRAGGSKDGSG